MPLRNCELYCTLSWRPPEVADRNTFGHWESDTVLGRKRSGEAAVFTIVERMTGYYLSIRIDGKTTTGIASAMEQHSAWERPVNERTYRILRKYIPKGCAINGFTAEQIFMFADELNATPRKRLGYQTPDELFDAHLGRIYTSNP
jgi:transposase, IS30 family